MIRSTWDTPFGPRGGAWKGPRKREPHVYIDRYDHKGLEELCQVEMTAGEGPSDEELKKAEEQVRLVLPLYLERKELLGKTELTPAEEAKKKELDRFFRTRWKKLSDRVRDVVERRARATTLQNFRGGSPRGLEKFRDHHYNDYPGRESW